MEYRHYNDHLYALIIPHDTIIGYFKKSDQQKVDDWLNTKDDKFELTNQVRLVFNNNPRSLISRSSIRDIIIPLPNTDYASVKLRVQPIDCLLILSSLIFWLILINKIPVPNN